MNYNSEPQPEYDPIPPQPVSSYAQPPQQPSSQPLMQDPYGQVAPAPSDKSWMAIVSLVTGILALCGWLFPICGFPLSIAAIIFGILGMKTGKRTMALIGLILGGLTVFLAIISVVVGVLIQAGAFGDILPPDIMNMFE